jgi:hypothetical protein
MINWQAHGGKFYFFSSATKINQWANDINVVVATKEVMQLAAEFALPSGTQ